MKKSILIILIINLFTNFITTAQDDMYIHYSNGAIVQISIDNMDSIIFYDKAPIYIEDSEIPDSLIISIAEFKNLAPEGFTQGDVKSLDTNLFVRGVITANDESGNIYKKMYIQDISETEDSEIGIPADEVQALEISLDKKYFYKKFPIGQKVLLRCKGFYVGIYSSYKQFGYIDSNGEPGKIPIHLVDSAILNDEISSSENIPEPKTSYNLKTFGLQKDICRLVKFKNISFIEPGVIYANEDKDYSEQIITDNEGNSMAVLTSFRANFASDKVPSGFGDISGILLPYYTGSTTGITNSLLIRSIDDVMMYNILYSYGFDSNEEGFTAKNDLGSTAWVYNTTDANMKISRSKGEGNIDYLISPEINLSTTENPTLNFDTRVRFSDSGETNSLTVLISNNYDSTNHTQNWTDISSLANFSIIDPSSTLIQDWINSGKIDLSAYSGSNVRIAFLYKSSDNNDNEGTTWEIDNVTIMDN